MSLLVLRQVSKRFGSLVAVDDLSLAVPPGEVHAFLGPNGAGKTTTMRMIVGLLQPDAGEILVDGCDAVRDGQAARRVLAYVPDEPYLFERLTGREFLDFTARVYGLDRATFAERLRECDDLFHLSGFWDRLAEGYSHGQRQRVVLAAAWLHRPRLLIVDEPLVGLDPRHIRITLDLFRALARDGGAVLMSTHTLSTVEASCDRVSVINHGRIIAQGTVAELSAGGDLEARFLEMTEGAPPLSAAAPPPA
ncbi:MAG: ABC transporter ATP-binding protein [Planctomycetota bacterium]|nr:ABC transporter ATP-binding protein [Planctomycetota bacterium]MCX8040631.1 ABC transporter ATP-binding protein [Planctomycetota bacterium]MDW8372373.1 ABC transporter ATP-binding protein [Planctomycetota bacterium]